MSKVLRIVTYETDYETGEPTEKVMRNAILKVEAAMFVWDGCHKIYLITGPEDARQLKECGWDESEFLPVSELPAVWEETCGLRFISSGDLNTQYVAQCEHGVVTYGEA